IAPIAQCGVARLPIPVRLHDSRGAGGDPGSPASTSGRARSILPTGSGRLAPILVGGDGPVERLRIVVLWAPRPVVACPTSAARTEESDSRPSGNTPTWPRPGRQGGPDPLRTIAMMTLTRSTFLILALLLTRHPAALAGSLGGIGVLGDSYSDEY